jgi:PKD repeat protein
VEVANSALIFYPLVVSQRSIVEGGSVQLNGTFYASQTNLSSSLSFNWGDGPPEVITLSPGVREFSRSHTYLQDSPVGYTIAVTLSDGITNAMRTTQIQVANGDPVIHSLNAGQILVALSPSTGIANVSATFSDPGTLDAHSVAWEWGDGTTNVLSNAQSPMNEFHSYAGAGVYGVSLTVADSGNAVTRSNLDSYLTVYNPAGAYFAGSGSIIAPVKTADTNQMMVRAPFGFVLQPATGTFGLRFRLNDTEFFSNHYDEWEENGSHTGGRITGTGTLNGANYNNGLPYNFVLRATLNSLQIQIATPVTNSVPYQTMNQALYSGSIIIK